MTKHEELCAAYRKSRTEFFQYNSQCDQFARRLYDDLIQYLGCSKNEVELKRNETSLEDSYYKFKIGIVLYLSSPNSSPQAEIVFHLCLKQLNSKWGIKLLYEDKLFEIQEDMSGATEFFDQLYSYILKNYENALKNFLDENKEKRKIGFDVVDRD